ncbi:hypothetical protein [Actinacidiphila sp. bgisy167]|uniref:hypothetical protein n=1 Tax=Actinacidiphila sp. bgisy167 TaxID=3413797 RepID=UPI003D7599E7
MGDVLTGTGTLDLADLAAFVAHVHQAAEVYRDVAARPPQGMTAEQALRALTRIPSHRLTTGLTRDERDRLLHTAHRSAPIAADERHLTVENETGVARGPGLDRHVDTTPHIEERPQATAGTATSRLFDAPHHATHGAAAAGTGRERRVLDRDGILEVAVTVRGMVLERLHHRADGRQANVEEWCVTVAAALRDQVYAPAPELPGSTGIHPGSTVDDLEVGTGRASQRLAPGGARWTPVGDWDVIHTALGDTTLGLGPGSMALVMSRTPNGSAFGPDGRLSLGREGHVSVAYHPRYEGQDQGAVWIEIAPDEQAFGAGNATPGIRILHRTPDAPLLQAQALIIDPSGQVVPHVLTPFQPSTSTTYTLPDPSTNPRYASPTQSGSPSQHRGQARSAAHPYPSGSRHASPPGKSLRGQNSTQVSSTQVSRGPSQNVSGPQVPPAAWTVIQGLHQMQAATPETQGTRLSASLGTDLFGLLHPAPVPYMLTDLETGEPYDYSRLNSDEWVYFLNAMDMRDEDSQPEDMDPEAWGPVGTNSYSHRRSTRVWTSASNAPLLSSPEVSTPAVVHAIWFGDPLREHGRTAGFWHNYGEAALRHWGEAVFVLWTDISRDDIAGVRDLSHRPLEEWQAQIWEMVQWAKRSRIALVNVHEVFNVSRPMQLHAEFMTEMVKQTGSGWAAASDILRLEIMTMGGMYSDGDNVIESLDALQQVTSSRQGYAVGKMEGGFMNSAFAAHAHHPFFRMMMRIIKEKYEMSQIGLFPRTETATPAAMYTMGRGIVRRNSVMFRTGPYSYVGMRQLLGWESLDDIPTLGGVTLRSDNSWIAPAPSVQRDFTAQQTTHFTARVVQTLVRGLYNRQGDLDLVHTAPTVTRHPSPDLIWQAALGYIASRQDLRTLVRGVTRTRLDPRGQTHITLPPAAEALIQPRTGRPPIGDAGGWWLGDQSQAITLLPLTPRSATTTSESHPPTISSPFLGQALTENAHTDNLNRALLQRRLEQLPTDDPRRTRVQNALNTHRPQPSSAAQATSAGHEDEPDRLTTPTAHERRTGLATGPLEVQPVQPLREDPESHRYLLDTRLLPATGTPEYTEHAEAAAATLRDPDTAPGLQATPPLVAIAPESQTDPLSTIHATYFLRAIVQLPHTRITTIQLDFGHTHVNICR